MTNAHLEGLYTSMSGKEIASLLGHDKHDQPVGDCLACHDAQQGTRPPGGYPMADIILRHLEVIKPGN